MTVGTNSGFLFLETWSRWPRHSKTVRAAAIGNKLSGMPNDEQYEELRLLIAALTERIYKLEQLAAEQFEGKERTTGTKRATGPLPAGTPSVADRHRPERDLESRIGGHWLNRVGIVAVLIGVSYFLKYAFDNEWVGPASRVMLGLIAGVAIVIWSD